MAAANLPKIQIKLLSSSAVQDPQTRYELNLIYTALKTIVNSLANTQIDFTAETITIVTPATTSESEMPAYSGLRDSEAKK